MVLVSILLMSAKLRILMLRKPAGVWKVLHEVMISSYGVFANDMTRHFCYDFNIGL